MSLRKLPEINALQEPRGYQWDVPSDALARWVELPSAAASEDAQTITVYDVIGEDPWSGGGFSSKKMAAILRNIGAKDVTVRINSPGGSVFEGFAIYNELRNHKAKVTVEIMGIAASAASYIAMAGDEIRMGLGTFLMIHNSWGMVIGNRNDLEEAMTVLEQIDNAQVDIFEARTGLSRSDILKYMDAETFFPASEAVAKGFADSLMERAATGEKAALHSADNTRAVKRLEAILAQAGLGRNERRSLIGQVSGSPAVAGTERSAVASEVMAGLSRLIATIRS